MIDLQKMAGFPARRPSRRVQPIQDITAGDDRSDSKHLSFINLPLLGLCVATWAVVSVGAVAIKHLF